jgi:hypothetical protein
MSQKRNASVDGTKNCASSVGKLDIDLPSAAPDGKDQRKAKRLPRLPRNSRKKSRV